MKPDFNKTSTFDYPLDQSLIAQNPASPRDSARLMVIKKGSTEFEHRIFRDVTEYLRPGDLLVMNDTRVLPARLEGRKNGDGAKVEIFFLSPVSENQGKWTALVKPGRKLPEGTKVTFSGGSAVIVGERLEDGLRYVYFAESDNALDVIHKNGQTPLPHYITESTADAEEYQTVYSKLEKENSVASPTAGLHFTNELLEKIYASGVEHAFVTLQVGLGTFRPVKSDNVDDHIMHFELCEISAETAEKINRAKAEGRRVVAVGTTVVRTLESFARETGKIEPGIMNSNLFIRPGFEFKIVDALITNFHLPKSTLLMLVSAFAGYDTIMAAYKTAMKERYRVFSFGDATFIQ